MEQTQETMSFCDFSLWPPPIREMSITIPSVFFTQLVLVTLNLYYFLSLTGHF